MLAHECMGNEMEEDIRQEATSGKRGHGVESVCIDFRGNKCKDKVGYRADVKSSQNCIPARAEGE